jgi:alkanesulfonate monooxygenase SsuD/methylene tetrahydromethanopterin reductase-like flavin-dependent oxidoreductase (luciferase family)
MLSVAKAADEHGFASIWAADHVVWPVEYASKYPYGEDKYPADENQPVCEVVTTMTWLSAHTSRVRVGSLVIVVPQRNPWVLGKQLATLDLLNGGRTILGAGMGWLREEFDVLQAWVPFGLGSEELRAGWDRVRRSAEEVGRDPSSLCCALWLPIALQAPDDPPLPPAIQLQGSAELLPAVAEL